MREKGRGTTSHISRHNLYYSMLFSCLIVVGDAVVMEFANVTGLTPRRTRKKNMSGGILPQYRPKSLGFGQNSPYRQETDRM